MRNIYKESFIVSSVKFIAGVYPYYVELRIIDIYNDSRASRVLNRAKKAIAVYFRYSFLERVSRVEQEKSSLILENSKFIVKTAGAYKALIKIFLKHFRETMTESSLIGLKEDFYKSTLRTSGIIFTVAVLTGISFSALFNSHIGLWGWIIRGILLFLGVSSLASNVDWPSLKNSSVIFRIFSK